jgi:hypothetical protein
VPRSILPKPQLHQAVLAPPPDRGAGIKTGAPRLLQAVSATANPIPTHLGPFKKRRAGGLFEQPNPAVGRVATGPVKFVVGALRRLDWTWIQVEDWSV